jgi:hypothetical protein
MKKIVKAKSSRAIQPSLTRVERYLEAIATLFELSLEMTMEELNEVEEMLTLYEDDLELAGFGLNMYEAKDEAI